MKRHAVTFSCIIWLCIWLFTGLLVFAETPKQIVYDKAFFNKVMKPPVEFVKKFESQQGRLPTKKEFNNWLKQTSVIQYDISYIRQQSHVIANDVSRFSGADWRKDFAVGVWRGEWEEYYFSWTNSYDVNNYSWRDGLISFSLSALIGILPLVVLLLTGRRTKLELIPARS